jgi:hypothetical protein
MAARQDSDNLAWDRSDELWEKAMKQVQLSSTCLNVESFAKRVLGQSATLIPPLIIAGFNVLYPIRVEGSSDSFLVRLPCPNQAVFPEEKTIAEAATTACITQRTQLTVPKVFCHGADPEIGPFMFIQDLGSRRGMGQALEAPREDPNETPILHPNISESKLKDLYVQMGQCLLQLAQPTFPRIGALVEINQGSYSVVGRPVTLNMIIWFSFLIYPSRFSHPKALHTKPLMTGTWYWPKCKWQLSSSSITIWYRRRMTVGPNILLANYFAD